MCSICCFIWNRLQKDIDFQQSSAEEADRQVIGDVLELLGRSLMALCKRGEGARWPDRKATRVLGTERAKRKTSRASRIQGGCFEAWARGGGSAGQAVERLLMRCISEACMQVLGGGGPL